MEEGFLLEYRIQRFLFHKGYTTRRSLPLKSYFYPDEIDLTDIDVYAIKFDEDFNETVLITECKSGTSKNVKAFDRLLWLRGLMYYLHIPNGMIFIQKKLSLNAKKFAHDNNIIPINPEWFDKIEKEMNLCGDWRGSYSIHHHTKMIKYYNDIKKSPDNLSRYYWFLKIKFWLLPPSIQIKEIKRGYEEFSKKCLINKDYEHWILCESIVLISIAALKFCKELYPLVENERKEWIKIKLMEGIDFSIEKQEKTLEYIKMYIEHKIYELTGKKTTISKEEFRIPPPEYTDNLIELMNRLLKNPKYSTQIPRFLDFITFEYILNDKNIDRAELAQLFPEIDLDLLAKMSKNLIRFLDPQIESRKVMNKLLSF